MMLLSALGLATISFFVIKLFSLVLFYLRPSRLSRFAHASPSGAAAWALVTGASDGIGHAFAKELAANGFNVALHGRDRKKLAGVIDTLQRRSPQREFKAIIADASLMPCTACLEANAFPDLAAIQQELSGLHLTILINNAGGGTGMFEPLSATPELVIAKNISLNALFPLYLTRALLPLLVQNGPSLVVNISTMGDAGFPLITPYCASKAFLMAATRAIRLEAAMSGHPVEVLGIRVGNVTGTQVNRKPSSIFLPTAETMAKAALARAGYGGGIVIGYWAHAIQQTAAGLFNIMPGWVEDNVKINIMRGIRELAFKEAKKV